MRDVLLKRPTGNSCNLLPYPVFIARLAIRHQVSEFPRDEIYNVQEHDMYCPYGDWKGEQPKVRCGKLIPPSQAPPVQQPEQQEEQQPPPLPAASEIPSSSIQHPPKPLLREIMRLLGNEKDIGKAKERIRRKRATRDAFCQYPWDHTVPPRGCKVKAALFVDRVTARRTAQPHGTVGRIKIKAKIGISSFRVKSKPL
ncbi:hypothetical protein PIB30_051789 [Stylosanthes scabra]|uniref:Uncharacterized protein n=1 Tax=Stylosanthes scabra TaxID=79078 RepID=A0ABU6SJ57_9FABA|nr:hypothetical protein [Stylosanthes scabra]